MSIDDNLFGQTYQQLLGAAAVGSDASFQLFTPVVPWWWPTAASGQIAPQAYNLVNQMPEWSAVGTYSPTGRLLTDAYRTVLPLVNISVPPAQQQQVQNAHDQLIAAQNQYSNDYASMGEAWVTAQNNLPPGEPAPDFTTWQQSSGWAGTLSADSANIAKQQQTYTSLVAQQNPTYQAATAAIVPPTAGTTKPGWTTMMVNGMLEAVPSFTIGTTGQDWVNLLSQGGNPVSISLSADQAGYDWSKSWASGNGELGVPYFELFADGSWQEMNLTATDSSVTVEVSLAASMQVPVSPDEDWFYGSYLNSLAKLPNGFIPPFTATGGSSPVFGEDGVMPAQIAALVAVYQPSYTIRMSSSTFQQHTQSYQASAGVRIGPWVFGEGSGGSSSDTWNADSATNTFSGKSSATYPFILGVLVTHPGLD